MNLDELRKAIVSRADEDGLDADALERVALRLFLEMASEPRRDVLTLHASWEFKDWPFISDRAARAIQLASDYLTGDDSRKPPRVKLRLKSLPKVREIFWCDFQSDAHLPELWKRRPVVIASFKHTLHGAVTVIPCSTQEQDANSWAVKLSTTIDGRDSWAICDKLTTVAVSRLSSDKRGIKRLSEGEFNELLKRSLQWLPSLPIEPDVENGAKKA
jgi:mRNA interferase MazF